MAVELMVWCINCDKVQSSLWMFLGYFPCDYYCFLGRKGCSSLCWVSLWCSWDRTRFYAKLSSNLLAVHYKHEKPLSLLGRKRSLTQKQVNSMRLHHMAAKSLYQETFRCTHPSSMRHITLKQILLPWLVWEDLWHTFRLLYPNFPTTIMVRILPLGSWPISKRI